MKIITTIAELKQALQAEKRNGKSIGYVPTMGFLHEGHVSLMERARKENDIVVLSIFVNPLQFGPNEDFETYPRDIERDENIARNAGVDYIFYPQVEEMYGSKPSVTVQVESRTDCLCGTKRPGHFDGVATVLTKFFNIIGPDKAYFGLKDAQQVAVVSGLIEDFNFPVELVPVDIVREEDGLAKSSRNVFLSETERQEAKELYQGLLQAKKAIEAGERDPNQVAQIVENHINTHTNGTIDYVEVYRYPELQPMETLSGHIIIAMAVKFANVRLIDNLTLTI
ncbi:pantoate--beta-alanine ligase [Bacillus sp. JJ634]